MAITVTFNGSNYNIPEVNDEDWGQTVTNYLVALSTGTLQQSGGTFTLTSNVDFGATYGLSAAFFSSKASDAASAGQLRLGNSDVISFRNSGDSANLDLGVGSADGLLAYNSIDLVNLSATQTLTNKTLTSPTINGGTLNSVTISGGLGGGANQVVITDGSGNLAQEARLSLDRFSTGTTNYVLTGNGASSSSYQLITDNNVDASAALTLSKLAATTASRALASDVSGFIVASSVTDTELGYVSGVTSSIQTQLNAKLTDITGEVINDLSDVSITTPADGDFLGYNSGSGNWENLSIALNDLSDVNAGSPTNGYFLSWSSGSGEWVPVAPSSTNDPQVDANPRSPSIAPNASSTQCLAIGHNAQATQSSCIAIGYNSTATAGATGQSLAVGYGATASGVQSTALGGSSSATGSNAIAAGNGAQATATYALALGSGSYASGYGSFAAGSQGLADREGEFCYSSAELTSHEAKQSIQVLAVTTSNATPLELKVRSSGGYLTLATDSMVHAKINVIATAAPTYGQYASYEFSIVARNVAGTSVIVGTRMKTTLHEDVSAWDCEVAVSDANDRITITATGEAAKNISWVATAYITEVRW